jgi:ParB/RepB/Spo0J family partition protein
MELIGRDRIHPNDWNVNAFDPEQYPKLVESLRLKGLMEPLKVTPDPAREGHYLMVDGYHRWKAAGELGIEMLPCEVWEISAEEAKLRGLQLNYLRGQPVPDRLAHLIHDLHRELTLEDLAGMLPWSTQQLRDSLELLKLPADLRQRVEEQAEAHAGLAPIPVTVVMLPAEHQLFEQALERARLELGKGARRGQLWAQVCRGYLGASPSSRCAEADALDPAA